jgi:hypothetical protein
MSELDRYRMTKWIHDVNSEGRRDMFIPGVQILDEQVLIIGDYQRWLDHEQEILADLARWGGRHENMLIYFKNPEDMTFFLLKWH